MTQGPARPADAASADAASVEVAAAALGHRARRAVPLGPLTTYRVGGPAALFVEARTLADLHAARDAVMESGVRVLVVGKGSNLLVADRGFDGLVLILGDGFASISFDGTTVHAGGAAPLPVVARRCAAAGLAGFEWAVGVPGSIGGAVRMNAGGHGSDMAASLSSARVVDLRGGEDTGTGTDTGTAALALGYRSSALAEHHVVVGATLDLATGDVDRSQASVAEIIRWRRAHQPGGQNAGSVFTNPPGHSAGALVEASGCRGLRRGSARVSAKHANFIIADADGRAGDVVALMADVQRRVADATGIVLQPETRLVGFGQSDSGSAEIAHIELEVEG